MVVHNMKNPIETRFATGGYTGDWATNEGRIAILDKK